MEERMMKQIREDTENRAASYWAANLPIGRSSGAACFVAPCGSCGNQEIATPFVTPIAIPGAQYA